MPSYVPRGMEPYKKRDQFDQRVTELQAAVRGGRADRITRAAERVRAAAFGVVKARQAIAKGRLSGGGDDTARRQLANVEADAECWAGRTVDDIVAEYGTGPPPDGDS